MPTLNLSFDFISAARKHEWIEASAELVTIKRRFAFSSGTIRNSEGVVCRFSGGFYLPDHAGLQPDPELLARMRQAGPDQD